MELAFGWMPFAVLGLLLLVVVTVVIVVLLRRRRADRDAVPVAHRERLTSLPGYRSALRRYRLVLAALLVACLAAITAGAIASARPIDSEVRDTTLVNRDIVLCLDISGSMAEADAAILETFRELAEGFEGERISLVLWDSSAVQTFPLTDDYEYIDGNLEKVAKAIDPSTAWEPGTYLYWAGTDLGDGYSLIGDGLASCVLRFDNAGVERSRTVILATDNFLNGTPIMTLAEAVDFAVEQDVRVYAIDPQQYGEDQYTRELAAAAEETGGGYYALSQEGAVEEVVERVLAEQAGELKGTPELVFTDVPVWPLVVGVLALWLVIGLGWWVRT